MAIRISFPHVEPIWAFERDCVVFPVIVDGRSVKCLISMEALMQRFGAAHGMDAAIEAFEKHKVEIHAAARAKIEAGEFNEKGEVVIRMADMGTTMHHLNIALHDRELHKLLGAANREVERMLQEYGILAEVEWRTSADSGARWLIQLFLKHKVSPATGVAFFTFAELSDSAIRRLRINHAIGDMVQEQVNGIRREIQDLATSAKED